MSQNGQQSSSPSRSADPRALGPVVEDSVTKGQLVQAAHRRTGRTSRWVAALAAPLALGALTGLTGCGAQRPDVAAQVGDRTITTAEVDSVVTQANSATGSPDSQQQQKMTSQSALAALMLAPYVASQLSGAGKAVSEDQAMRKVFPGVAQPSEALRKVAQFQLGAGSLTSEQGNAVLSQFAKDGYEINPRYGTLTLPQGWSKVPPNWMVAGDEASADATTPQ